MLDTLLNGAKGFFRTLGGLVGAAGAVMMVLPLPQVQAWGAAAVTLGGLIAGGGAVRAGLGALVAK